MSADHAGSKETLEARVHAVLLALVHERRAFTPFDVAERLEPELGAIPIPRIAKIVRRAFEEGMLRPFGYRRTLAQERTRQGVITAVSYAPPSIAQQSARPSSRAPTRAPPARTYGYLDLPLADVRRLERQTATIRRQIDSTAGDLVRLGELLEAARALVGPAGLSRYVERELGMSTATALRWMRIARLFRGHPALERLSVLRPAVLYKLSEPSFPSDLREAILRDQGAVIDGAHRPLHALRVRDLAVLKARSGGARAAEPAADPEPLEALARQADALTGDPGLGRTSALARQRTREALRRALARLEGEDE